MELIFLLLLLVVVLISHSLYSLSFVLKPKPGTEKLQIPPGETGWPFIGETTEYLSMARKNCTEKFLSDRTKKYSSKLFKTSYIGETMVFICSAEGNKFLFSNDNKLVKSWWPSNFDRILDHSNEINRAKEIGRMRKQISTLFTGREALENNVGFIDAVTQEHFQKYWNCKEVVKVDSLAKKLTFGLSCRFVLSLQDSETVEEIEKLFNCLREGLFSLPINFPGTKLNRGIRAAKQVREMFEALITQRKIEVLEKIKSESKDMLSMLLESYNDAEDMNESDLAIIVLGYILAAYDSASPTMVSIVKYLAELPQVYEEVHKEQMEIANSKGPEELLNMEDIKKMRYSWNVACEVLRLQPPSPGTFREAITTFTYDGYQIPKGWKLHWAAHATHKNPEYFPDPEKFDPSRFEENEIIPFSYVPFGAGPHMCPGREYVRIKILIFMHNLVKRFKWEKVIRDEQMIRDPVLRSANGLSIRLYPYQSCP